MTEQQVKRAITELKTSIKMPIAGFGGDDKKYNDWVQFQRHEKMQFVDLLGNPLLPRDSDEFLQTLLSKLGFKGFDIESKYKQSDWRMYRGLILYMRVEKHILENPTANQKSAIHYFWKTCRKDYKSYADSGKLAIQYSKNLRNNINILKLQVFFCNKSDEYKLDFISRMLCAFEAIGLASQE